MWKSAPSWPWRECPSSPLPWCTFRRNQQSYSPSPPHGRGQCGTQICHLRWFLPAHRGTWQKWATHMSSPQWPLAQMPRTKQAAKWSFDIVWVNVDRKLPLCHRIGIKLSCQVKSVMWVFGTRGLHAFTWQKHGTSTYRGMRGEHNERMMRSLNRWP